MNTPITITVPMIKSWRPAPCYDPNRHLPEDWSGTALDLLRIGHIPPEDRLWCVLRPEVLDLRTRRLCACAIVRKTPLHDGRTAWDLLTDPRSRQVIEVADAWCRGEATDEELDAAWAAARASAQDTARAEARAAAWDAAWNAAGAAARDAAWNAAGAAARAAAWYAAVAAAVDAAGAAAVDAAWAATRAAQVQIVIDVLEEVYA